MKPVDNISTSQIDQKVIRVTGLVALDFYQASCAPCRALEPRLQKVAEQYSGRGAVYRVDLERDMPVAERFGVKSIPTVLVFLNGSEVERLDGLITDERLEQAFARATRAA